MSICHEYFFQLSKKGNNDFKLLFRKRNVEFAFRAGKRTCKVTLRSIYTKVQFLIGLVCVLKKAEKFCSYEQDNLMQNWPLKSDV